MKKLTNMAQTGELTTYEQVEQYVDELNAQQPEGAAGAMADGAIAGGIEQVCKYYKIVKPILKFIIDLPLIPEKIKKPVKTFMGLLDTLCPA